MFVALSIPAMISVIYFLPASWGLDEQVHTARAYQVSQFNSYPDVLGGKGRFGGQIPQSLEKLISNGHAESNSVDRGKSFLYRQDLKDIEKSNSLSASGINPNITVEYEFGPTGPYSPLVYTPSAIGMAIAKNLKLSVGEMILLARILQAMMYVIVCFSALYIVRNYKARWLIFTVALLPASVYQAITINADAYTTAFVLLFLALLYKLYSQENIVKKVDIGLLASTSLLLMATKPSYAIFLVLILFLPKSIFKNNKHKQLVVWIIFLMSIIVLALVSLKGVAYGDSILLYRDAETASRISLMGQLGWILGHPVEFMKVLAYSVVSNSQEWGFSLIGVLGYNTITTPYPLVILSYGLLAVSGLYASIRSSKTAITILAVGVLSALSIIVLLYATFNEVGSSDIGGVQGRYFIPCIPLIVLGLSRLIPIDLSMSSRNAKIVFILGSTAVLYGTVIAYLKVIT